MADGPMVVSAGSARVGGSPPEPVSCYPRRCSNGSQPSHAGRASVPAVTAGRGRPADLSAPRDRWHGAEGAGSSFGEHA